MIKTGSIKTTRSAAFSDFILRQCWSETYISVSHFDDSLIAVIESKVAVEEKQDNGQWAIKRITNQ